MRIVKVVLALLLAVVVLGGGSIFVLSKQKPSVGAGLPTIVASAAAARSFDRKADTLKAAADEAKKTGKPTDVEVTFTAEELTSKAQEAATSAASADGGAPLAATNTQVHLVGSNIIATSDVTVSGFTLSVGVVATPTVVDGKTKVVVTEIQTGALPIPDAIKQQINAQIGNAVDPASLGIPIDLSQLTIVDGKLVLKGTAKP